MLISRGCNNLKYNKCDVEYSVFTENRLAWCDI